jgi:1-pyrroline-5-carboxylate dehydrogenase
VPRSLWDGGLRDELAAEVDGLAMGDVSDLSNFIGAVIDDRAFAKNKAAIDRAKSDPSCEIVAGGTYDDSVGWFVRPTVIVCSDPENEIFKQEYFGPVIGVHVYDDENYDAMLDQMESASAYALTGAILATDRRVLADATAKLRFAAGNFYLNDRPTGSVVGQQPFGGARASGTNDKAGSKFNLLRWSSPRAIKETMNAATDYRYPHMG